MNIKYKNRTTGPMPRRRLPRATSSAGQTCPSPFKRKPQSLAHQKNSAAAPRARAERTTPCRMLPAAAPTARLRRKAPFQLLGIHSYGLCSYCTLPTAAARLLRRATSQFAQYIAIAYIVTAHHRPLRLGCAAWLLLSLSGARSWAIRFPSSGAKQEPRDVGIGRP